MTGNNLTRREFVGAAAVGLAATAGAAQQDAGPQPHEQVFGSDMPYGMIGDLKISRLILGSNQPGAHSRDLIYVSALGNAYNTRERILDTYELAESEGINTILQGHEALIREYNAQRGGSLRTIKPVNVGSTDDEARIRATLTGAMQNDLAAAFYIWGDQGDYLAMAKRIDLVGTAMEVARELGILLGLGAHALEVPIQCEDAGIRPDFYVKTFHDDDYWSATPKKKRKPFCWYDNAGGNSYSGKTGDHDDFHDNIWCLDPEKTTKVMRQVEVPWIAFKVLAAGAIHPRDGFSYAFRNGADFVAVGMLDFQLAGNADLVRKIARRLADRDRPWRA